MTRARVEYFKNVLMLHRNFRVVNRMHSTMRVDVGILFLFRDHSLRTSGLIADAKFQS